MPNTIGFFRPNEENGYLSNWYPSKFIINHIEFKSAEQYLMYSKAELFKDGYYAMKILNTNNQREIKDYGRKVHNFNEKIWKENRERIMYEALYAKFTQNDDLKIKLLHTDDAILVECSPYDRIWGIGISTDDDLYKDSKNWKGKNLLGKTLMKVRTTVNREINEKINKAYEGDRAHISPVTIASLIRAHMEGDEQKFIAYANFIADKYSKAGDALSEQIIRSSIDGTDRNQPKVVLNRI